MQTLTTQLLANGLTDRVLSEGQLRRLLSGSDQRRYHLVNRATEAGELLRLRRGRYVVASGLRRRPVHPFALAQAFVAGSFVSFESALSYHGWIPEAVRTIASVSPRRKSSANQHDVFGSFSFHPLALQPGSFLMQVERIQLDGQTALVARPLRALMDLICLRKREWQGMRWLVDGLRIDADLLQTISGEQIRELLGVYSQRRVHVFLARLGEALGDD